MFILLAFVMMGRAVIEASMMRLQQSLAFGSPGYLPPEHFAELFTTHGTIMIFFMAMPFLTGMINYAMPMQIGARDVSFPLMNSISLAFTAAGAVIMMVSLDLGRFSTGGWSGYPPYTERTFNAGVGPDYWIWAVTLSTHRLDDDRHQLRRHDLQEAGAGHAPLPHAAVHAGRRCAPAS